MRMTPQLYTAHLPGGSAAVMDTRTGRGRWRHFNTTAAHLWKQLADGIPLDQALDDLTDHFVRQGANRDTVRADLETLAGQLRDTGLLTAHISTPPSPTTPEARPPLPADTPLGVADRIAGLLGLTTALILLRCAPIRISIAVAGALGRTNRPAASGEQADLLFHAVRHSGRFWPGRAACLEESLAAYVAAILRGRRVTWVIGARTAPAAAHAWIEAGGEVVGQDLADRLWPYAPALRV
ncbi:lasso peptide biosynthesis B2 protein [Streptomyces sp. NBC_00102]|uniref:lasso peptide biosynthesis B2 protein n=1 Tax=Streptomyces sp. NBC_00102 TaxID=2975652 RepID=UPI00224F5607|nr:lasso peptide biosynthesis B2 protein [Streptomyces sp. NBC_00102]MCX5401313.1 lasso peptide biosynthesis B2 protein [Streptomyces sp. NBC_00102]